MAGQIDDDSKFLKAIDKGALIAEGFRSGIKQKQERLAEKVRLIKLAEQQGEKITRKVRKWVQNKEEAMQRSEQIKNEETEWGVPAVYNLGSVLQRFIEEMKSKHQYFNIFFVYLPGFSRPQRLLWIWSATVGCLASNALTYNLTNPDYTLQCTDHSSSISARVRGDENVRS
jgi:hypothetical protein